MIHIQCQCGEELDFPASMVGQPDPCPACGRMLCAVGGAGEAAGDVKAPRLSLRSGPTGVGTQFFLVGGQPIEIGKLPEKPIHLPGTQVSRTHCRLVPIDGHWRVEDQRSTNGLFVDGYRITRHDLADGDVVRVGEYELVYDSCAPQPAKVNAADSTAKGKPAPDAASDPSEEELFADVGVEYEMAPAPPPPARVPMPAYLFKPHSIAGVAAAAAFNPAPTGPAPVCPSCEKTLAPGAKICVACGIQIKSGRPLIISQGVDLDRLYHNATQIITWLSWVVTFGIYPIASEGFGLKKPYAVWGIAIVTVLVSLSYNIYDWTGGDMQSAKQLMLWSGSRDPNEQLIERAYEVFPRRGDALAYDQKVEELSGTVPKRDLAIEAYKQLTPREKVFGEFRVYQLITHIFLHGGLMHLAGNMIFFLVFGSRVNALIGNVKTLILYPILGICASTVYLLSVGDSTPVASLGASGAIMGLAGMYLVLFPVHKVHMTIWLRPYMLLLLFGPVSIMGLIRVARFLLRLYMKIWSLRGFWVVLFYIAFDIFATLRGSHDGVAHWAHLGGFIAGAAIALGLVLGRQVNARGGDLISLVLGKYAWPLLGKPSQRKEDPELIPVPRGVVIPAK